MNFPANLKLYRGLPRRLLKAVWSAIFFLDLLLACGLTAVKFYLIPNINDHRDWLEKSLSDSIQQSVQISEIEARWDGLNPDFIFSQITVSDEDDATVFSFEALEVRISAWSLFIGEIDPLRLKIFSPKLSVKRDKNNVIWLGGKRVYPFTSEQGPLLNWLVRQKQVEISGGSLSFVDEILDNYSITLNEVLLTTSYSAGVTSVVLSSEMENDWYDAFNISLVSPNLVNLNDGSEFLGNVSWNVSALRLSPFDNWVPSILQLGNTVLNSHGVANFEDGNSQRVVADIRVNDFSLATINGADPVEVSQASFQASWEASSDRQEMVLSNIFAVVDSGLPVHLDVVRIDRNVSTGRNQIVTRDLSVDVLKFIGRRVVDAEDDLALVDKLLPGGILNLVDVSWQSNDGFNPPRDLALQTRFENIGFYASGQTPGLQGLTGAIKFENDQFLVQIDSKDMLLDVPEVFVQPINFNQFRSNIMGRKTESEWVFDVSNTRFSNADLVGEVYARLGVSHEGQSNAIDLRLEVESIDASRLSLYLPNKLLKTKAWVESRVLSGRVEDLVITASGDLSTSFLARGGEFELSANIMGGSVEVGGGWPRVDEIYGAFGYVDNTISFSPVGAKIFGVDVSRSYLSIDKAGTPDATLNVNGGTTATAAKLIHYIKNSPLDKLTKGVVGNMFAEGVGELNLVLSIPLFDRKKSKVNGSVHIKGPVLRVSEKAPQFHEFDAVVDFDKARVGIRSGHARIFDAKTTFISRPVDRGFGAVEFKSQASVNAFMDYLRLPLDPQYLSGQLSLSGLLGFTENGLHIDLNADLHGVTSGLPEPLATFEADKQKFRVQYLASRSGSIEINVANKSGELGSLVFLDGELVRGTLNTTVSGQNNVLFIGGEMSHLDIDGWRDLLRKINKNVSLNVMPLTVRVDALVDRLDAFGNTFEKVSLDGQFFKREGLFTINSQAVAGKVVFSGYGSDEAKVSASLERLSMRWPTTKQTIAKTPRLPIAVDAVINDFQLNGSKRGAITLRARPNLGRWEISELSTITDTGTFTMRGQWEPKKNSSVNYDVEFNIQDVGQYLFSLEGEEDMVGGVGRLTGSVKWEGSPFAIDIETLHGELDLEVTDGRFSKISPGAGHLISLLSLQALPRRITLDFRDVFSSGFSFDRIESEIVVANGIASTDKLLMEGTSASVAISGSVDMVTKNQNLEVFVTPKLGSATSSVAGAVAVNPAIGLAAFLAQKLLGNPFDKIATRQYRVQGNWSEPEVTRIHWGGE